MRGCINKVGNSWGYTITIGKDNTGKRIQKRYGKYKTKKDAEAACNKAIYELEHGSFVDTKKWTVAEYMREWIELYKTNLAINTYRGYKVGFTEYSKKC